MTDDGVHELQLNGKQLVFLFMATVVAGVVVFLLGVMVGRDMRGPRAGGATELAADPLVDPTRPDAALPSPTSTTTQDNGTPVTAQETLTYAGRLEEAVPDDTLSEPVADPRPAPVTPTAPVTPPAPARGTGASATPPAGTNAAAATGEPAGTGYVVQIAAVKTREEADTIARRLAAKGYPTFVTTPGTGAPTFYRVRVGKYPDRREAESIASRLQREEQFNPWITR